MRTREGGREQFCVGREDEREMVRGALEANSFQNYRVSQKKRTFRTVLLLPILQPPFISWLDESEYLLARYEWGLEDWEEQHSSESAFFWDTLYI